MLQSGCDCGSNDGDGGVISGDRVVVTMVGVILGSGDSGVRERNLSKSLKPLSTDALLRQMDVPQQL